MNRDPGTNRDPVDAATRMQKEAARPDVSVSLRASAGSGKTKVLVDRFIRLCVEDGPSRAEPRSILAVTFTRKAAVEIQQRLLARARAMALADRQTLRAELAGLCDRPAAAVTDGEMTAAAGLFEKILEDVSGLNVGTIHAFCQSILGRFAAEAGLDPHAVLLENTDDLVEEALDQLEREIAADADLAAASLAAGKDPGAVRAAVRDMHQQRLRLDRWGRTLQAPGPDEGPLPPLRRTDLLEPMLAQVTAGLLAGLGLPDDDPVAGLLVAVGRELEDLPTVGLDRVEQQLGPEIPRDQAKSLNRSLEDLRTTLAELRDRWRAAAPPEKTRLVTELKRTLLTTNLTPRKWSRVRKEGLGDFFNGLVLEQVRPLLILLRSHGYLDLLAVNGPLLRLALRLMDICDELKRRDQVIDFQDLEDFASRLMGDRGRALSLLYRLDDSIRHILVDEFQDTNFNQWDILVHFVEEFLSGGPDPDQVRTVFFVGDVKQSIYGFRGAEPELFPQVTELLERFEQLSLKLPTNFRSTADVVDTVGCVFTAPPLVDMLPPGEVETVRQLTARPQKSGAVVVLDPFCSPTAGRDETAPADEDDEAEEPDEDDPPLFASGDQQAAAVAARLARDLVEQQKPTWEGFGDSTRERPLAWGDILVLCRSRTEIAVYEHAFRDAGIPVAAAGSGTLAASREVQDVLALLRWLAYPEDDVALCTVLRSPVFRFSEGDFQAVLARRGLDRRDDQGRTLPPERLWRTLRDLEEDPRLGQAAGLLKRWRSRVGRESCHDLLRRIFREGALLERFEAAGGDQARQNLLRLYDLALAPDVAATPTVRRLVEVIERAARLGAEQEAVTPPDRDMGRVRFMTIHGAKGLEAPVVFLVDADRPLGKQDLFVRLDPTGTSSPLLFRVDRKFREGFRGAELPTSPLEAAAAVAAARGRTEDANLLYVALTRARDRLFVLGGEKCRGENRDSFLRQLTAAALAADCHRVERLGPSWLMDPWEAAGPAVDPPVLPVPVMTESRPWTPPAMTPRVRTVIPSSVQAEGAPDAGPEVELESRHPQTAEDPGPGRQGAIDRGNLVHLLLQQAADLGTMPPGSGPEHAEARAVFTDPDLAWVFHPEQQQGRGLSEVPVIHRRAADPGAAEERVTGIIDRLVLRPGRADIIDYKTNRTGGDPGRLAHLIDHYRPQLAVYRQVVAALYPDREVGAWLLFTDPDLKPDGGRLKEVT